MAGNGEKHAKASAGSLTDGNHRARRLASIGFLLAIAGAAGATYWSVERAELKSAMQEQERALHSITTTKHEQFAYWARNRLRDVRAQAGNLTAVESAFQLAAAPADRNLQRKVRSWLESLCAHTACVGEALLDRSGRVMLSVGEEPDPALLAQILGSTRVRGEQAASDMIYEPPSAVRIVFGAVLADGSAHEPLRLVQTSNAARYVLATQQEWPALGQGAEFLLVKAGRNNVLCLKRSAGDGTEIVADEIPLGNARELPVMAVLGQHGRISNARMKGRPVEAQVRAVESTSWHTVAAADFSHARSEARRAGLLAASSVASLGVAVLAAVSVSLRRQRKRYDRRVRAAESERLFHSQRYEYLAQYANDAILLMTPDGNILEANRKAQQLYGYAAEDFSRLTLFDLRLPEHRALAKAQLAQARESGGLAYETRHLNSSGEPFDAEVRLGLILAPDGPFILSIVRDITRRKRAEAERERMIEELREAMDKVETLSGLLPICAACKKIRDDHGYWQQVEVYVSERADVRFSHGICPDCARKLYPDYLGEPERGTPL